MRETERGARDRERSERDSRMRETEKRKRQRSKRNREERNVGLQRMKDTPINELQGKVDYTQKNQP